MALARVHSQAADGTFSADGATYWNAGHAVTGAVSGGIPYFDSTTSEATSALLASGGVVLGGGAGTAPSTNANLSFNGSTLLVPTGTLETTPGIAFTGSATTGFSFASNVLDWMVGGQVQVRIPTYAASTPTVNWGTLAFGFAAGSPETNAPDISLSRIGAGVLGAGTGAPGEVDGTFRGLYQSSDGTAGATAGPFTTITSITIKNGLVTSLSGT